MWRILFLLMVVLAACGRAEVDVQVADPPEATAIHNQQATQIPNEDGLLFYESEQSGLYFHYPAAWQVQEQRGHITVNGDAARLTIEYGTDAFASGSSSVQTADQSLTESDSVALLGELHATYLDEGAHRLYYTISDETGSFEVANMRVSIWLESENWPLSPESRQLAGGIVESVGFRWLVTRPSAEQIAGWEHYADAETGLQFDYPTDWQVTREPDAIVVTCTDAQLFLVFSGGPSGLPAGEFRKGDPTHIWLNDAAVPRVHLMYDDQIKAVYYGPPVTPIPIGEHSLLISVAGTSSIPYETLDLAPDTLRQMDWIVTTLQS